MTRILSLFAFLTGLLLATVFLPGEILSPATEPTTTRAPLNIETTLAKELPKIDATEQPVEKLFNFLRDEGNMNLVVNWQALEAAGITRQTNATLHLEKVPFEQAVRALCEVVEPKGTRLNYVVGEGAVVITTNEELAKSPVMHLFDVSRILRLQLVPPPPLPAATLPTDTQPATATAPAENPNAPKLLAILKAELARIGERSEGKDRELYLRRNYLIATQSRRALDAIQRVIQAFASPLKPGTVPSGVIVSVRQKRALEQLLKLLEPSKTETHTLAEILPNVRKNAPELNIVYLPHAEAQLKSATPELDILVNDSGIVYVGLPLAIRARTLFAVYDLHDLIKRLALKPENKDKTPSELAAKIVAALKAVSPTLWTDLSQGPCSLTEFEGFAVVFAPPSVYRSFNKAFQDVQK